MPTEGFFPTLQKLATALHRLDELAEDVKELKRTFTERVDKAEIQIANLRERLARLEASREADQAHIRADIARFKAEIERAELRLSRSLPPAGQ